MSRSCQRATFSRPTAAAERTTRARPHRRSATIGFRLCGIAEEPFWPARTVPGLRAPPCGRGGVSPSRSARPMLPRERGSRGARRGGRAGSPASRRARGPDRGARRRCAPPPGRRRRRPRLPRKAFRPRSLPSARSSRCRSRSSSKAQPASLAPKRDRLGMHAVRPAHHWSVAVLVRPGHHRSERALEPVEDEFAGVPGLKGQSRVEDVRRRQPVVQPATHRPQLFLDCVDEGGEVVLRPRLDLGDALRRRSAGTLPDLGQRVTRDDAGCGPALERCKLHLEPPRELSLVRPDCLHGRTGVTLDHPPDSSGGAGGRRPTGPDGLNPTTWTVRMVRRRWPGVRFS